MRTTVHRSRAELNFRTDTAVIMRGIVRGIGKATSKASANTRAPVAQRFDFVA